MVVITNDKKVVEILAGMGMDCEYDDVELDDVGDSYITIIGIDVDKHLAVLNSPRARMLMKMIQNIL